MAVAEPLFIVDLRDAATGKQVAVHVTRAEALLPLGALLRRVLHGEVDQLVAAGCLAPAAADSAFRLQDLVFPVDDAGALASRPYEGLVFRWRDDGPALDPAQPAAFERLRQHGAADVLVLALDIDRQGCRYDRNWAGFHRRRFRRFQPVVDQLQLLDAGLQEVVVTDLFTHGIPFIPEASAMLSQT